MAKAVLISGIAGASDRWFIKISLCTKSAFQHRFVEIAFFGYWEAVTVCFDQFPSGLAPILNATVIARRIPVSPTPQTTIECLASSTTTSATVPPLCLLPSMSLPAPVLAQGKPRHRHPEFLSFLRHPEDSVRPALDVHLIVDNYATHKHPKVRTWLAQRPRFPVHYTPRIPPGSIRWNAGLG